MSGKNVDLPLGPVKQIRIHAVEGRGSPTFTRICKSAINCLDYGNIFSGIQTGCLWQTICILERQLGYWSVLHRTNIQVTRKQWRKFLLRSLTFWWQCTSAQVIGCSASSLQLWICSTKPSCLKKCHLTPSNYFLSATVKANSHRHARHDTDRSVLSCLVWRCELSRLDRQTGAFCVWSVSECVGRRSATIGRTPTQKALVRPTQFTPPGLTVFKMATVCHLEFWKFKIFNDCDVEHPFCTSMPMLVKIGQTVAEIQQFLWYSR